VEVFYIKGGTDRGASKEGGLFFSEGGGRRGGNGNKPGGRLTVVRGPMKSLILDRHTTQIRFPQKKTKTSGCM